MKKYISLIAFIIFSINSFHKFFQNGKYKEISIVESQEAFYQNLDEKNLVVFKTNILNNKEDGIYIY
jgi:hypothetical protein